ncbi:MAG: PQQ-binding-like beta-propeller repeat protein, partial [Planctomycetaceae bacterium]|nr:PQQ-binding-like beta-propeller repeat protein [Planctomycetaceae bacterium]
LTTMDKGPKVETVALNAKDGKVLWRREATMTHPDKGKRLATATPATDGELVFSFFGSSGLHCYDAEGHPQWMKDFGPLVNQFNHAASPLIVGNRVILLIDHDGDSLLVALDKQTGKELWRSHRFVFGRNYASPVIWKSNDATWVLVIGSGVLVGYEVESGTPAWYVRSTCAVVNPSPVVGDNGWIYVHGSSPSSGAKSTPFGRLVKSYDGNQDEALQLEELPPSFLKTFFSRFDRDTSGGISEKEYDEFKDISRPFQKGMVAIKPGGAGEWSQSQLAWTVSRSMPRTPSALYQSGVIYVVNEGGVLQSLDAKTGTVLHQGRIAARGTIYSSPVLGDGKIYIGTLNGEVTVISAEPQWKTLHSAKLDSEIQACPAIADGRVYFRTKTSLYCFGLKDD